MKKLNNHARAVLVAAILTTLVWLLQANYELVVNRSESLPIHFVLVEKGKLPKKSDQIFVFKVRNNPHYKMKEMNFIKRAVGFEGDEIKIKDREVYVAGKLIGVAKTHSLKGLPLKMISTGIIPPHKFFAHTPHVDSFDSRYQDLGLVDEKDIIGTALVAF
jgi:conjugal transfer pilin signal peptidase TrbI